MKHLSRQVRRSEVQIKSLLRKKEQNNLSVMEFCKIHRIHKATFYNWVNKYSPAKEKQERFIPVQFSGVSSEPALFAEIERSGRSTVRLFREVPSSYIKSLL